MKRNGVAATDGARPTAGVRPGAPPTVASKTIEPGQAPRILTAVLDQHGDSWVRFGTDERSVWFAVGELASEPARVFRRLGAAGIHILTNASQNALKHEVEACPATEQALVAARPGWLEDFYVFGDGTVCSPPADRRDVIVAFEPDQRFRSQGSLVEWQEAIGPIVARQPLPVFAIALALSAPLLRFLPSGYTNPLVEVIGRGQQGKSIVGSLATSVWAGNPGSDTGGGDSWDMTLNAFDALKLARRDGFLFLDEGNLAGPVSPHGRQLIQQVVFKGATTGVRRRMTDSGQAEHARLVLFSTTNTCLADLLGGNDNVRDAARSRMISVQLPVDAPHGVLASVPKGFAASREAIEALRAAVDLYWGSAGRAFTERLVLEASRNEPKLKRLIAEGLDNYISRDAVTGASPRLQKSFGAVAVAAALGQRWGVLPKAWVSAFSVAQYVGRLAVAPSSAHVATLSEIERYLSENRTQIVDVADLNEPMNLAAFANSAGFVRGAAADRELLVPAATFQDRFPDHLAMMRRLRDAGLARTEGGHATKLTIKTPRAICTGGRVYCIRLQSSATGAAMRSKVLREKRRDRREHSS